MIKPVENQINKTENYKYKELPKYVKSKNMNPKLRTEEIKIT